MSQGPGGALLKQIHHLTGAFPLVRDDFKVPKNVLTGHQIALGDEFDVLLHWITPDVVASLPNQCRDSLAAHILSCSSRSLAVNEKVLVLKLPIFKELKSTEIHQGPTLT